MMLWEQVEERENEGMGGILTAAGTCKFCKQIATRKVLEEWGMEEIDELVTETCECLDAKLYAGKKQQKERANNRIELLFGKDNNSVAVPDAVLDLLHKAVCPICEGFVQSIAVDIGNGVKGKISITSKGNVKVVRTKMDTSTYEA